MTEIDERQNQKFEVSKELFLTQKDKVDLIDRIQSVENRIETAKADMIKWMFIFWMGQLVATAGILFAFLNVYFKK